MSNTATRRLFSSAVHKMKGILCGIAQEEVRLDRTSCSLMYSVNRWDFKASMAANTKIRDIADCLEKGTVTKSEHSDSVVGDIYYIVGRLDGITVEIQAIKNKIDLDLMINFTIKP